MFIDQHGNQVNIYAQFTYNDVTYGDLRSPEVRQMCWVTEVPDPQPPEDYSEELYFRTEQPTAPYVVWTKKPQAMLDQQAKAHTLQQIASLEQQSLLPRPVRDAILALLPATDPTHARVKLLEDNIAQLRASI
jgi:hypothetical protein